jgi:hypothetical protein
MIGSIRAENVIAMTMLGLLKRLVFKMKYKLDVKKNKDGNFTIWKIDNYGVHYPILNADEELLKKIAKKLKKAGF